MVQGQGTGRAPRLQKHSWKLPSVSFPRVPMMLHVSLGQFWLQWRAEHTIFFTKYIASCTKKKFGVDLASNGCRRQGSLWLWYLTPVLFCGVLMASLPEEQPVLANGVFCFFFQFLWSRGEDGFAQLCSWKVQLTR